MGTLKFNLLYVLVGKLGHGKAGYGTWDIGKLGHGKAGYEFWWHLRLFGGAAAPEHSSAETTASDGRLGSPADFVENGSKSDLSKHQKNTDK